MAWRRAAAKSVIQSDLQYRWVFLEDEGCMVGKCELPQPLFTMLRCAPMLARVVVPKEARVTLLLHEYTSSAAQGNDPEKWLSDMLLSVDRLTRKIGEDRVATIKELLRARGYDKVVRALLEHYDHLYDLHATSRGSDGTDRRHHIVDVVQASDVEDYIDADGLARSIIKEVAAYDKVA